jgi:hypothetical protein
MQYLTTSSSSRENGIVSAVIASETVMHPMQLKGFGCDCGRVSRNQIWHQSSHLSINQSIKFGFFSLPS